MSSEKRSAGLMLFRRRAGGPEVFLVHPGGPFFARRDEGSWSIPKGEVSPGEDPLEVALREFAEETGQTMEACCRVDPRAPGVRDPRALLVALGSARQRGGKMVDAWAFEGDWPEGARLHSNTFTMEWPPGSGRERDYPEVDRGEFFPVAEARKRINPAQARLLDRLLDHLGERG